MKNLCFNVFWQSCIEEFGWNFGKMKFEWKNKKRKNKKSENEIKTEFKNEKVNEKTKKV